MNDKATLVINSIINKENMAELPTYLEAMTPVFMKNGANPVGKYKTIEVVTGERSPEMIAVFDFPNVEAIKDLVNGADYKNLNDLRSRVFSSLNLMICSAQ